MGSVNQLPKSSLITTASALRSKVKKEKKGFVAKLLGGSKAPEKFGDVDAGVGTVIEDWDE